MKNLFLSFKINIELFNNGIYFIEITDNLNKKYYEKVIILK